MKMSTRRMAVLVMGLTVAVTAALFLPGCKSLPERLAQNGRGFAVSIGGEYKDYVANDSSLTADQKQSRIDAVDAQVAMWDEYLSGDSPGVGGGQTQ